MAPKPPNSFDEIIQTLKNTGQDPAAIKEVEGMRDQIEGAARADQEFQRMLGNNTQGYEHYLKKAIEIAASGVNRINESHAALEKLEDAIKKAEEAKKKGTGKEVEYWKQAQSLLNSYTRTLDASQEDIDRIVTKGQLSMRNELRDEVHKSFEKHKDKTLQGMKTGIEELVKDSGNQLLNGINIWQQALTRAHNRADVKKMTPQKLMEEIQKKGGPTRGEVEQIRTELENARVEGREPDYTPLLQQHVENRRQSETDFFRQALPASHYAQYQGQAMTLTDIHNQKMQEVLGADDPYRELSRVREEVMGSASDEDQRRIQTQAAQMQARGGGSIQDLAGLYVGYSAAKAFRESKERESGTGAGASWSDRARGYWNRIKTSPLESTGDDIPPVGPPGSGGGGGGGGGSGGGGGGGGGGDDDKKAMAGGSMLGHVLGGGHGPLGKAHLPLNMGLALANMGLNFATPSPGTVVQNASEAASSVLSPTTLGLAGLEFGGPVGGVIGLGIGSLAQNITAPWTSYMQRQSNLTGQFGPEITGTGEVEGRRVIPSFFGQTRPQSPVEQLMHQQTVTRLAHPTVSGEEIDKLTEALGKLGTTAEETTHLLDTGATMMEKYGMTADQAAPYTNIARYSQYGNLGAQAAGERRANMAAQGVDIGAQDDMVKMMQDTLKGVLNPDRATAMAQDILQGYGNMPNKEAQQMSLDAGAPQAFGKTQASAITNTFGTMGYMSPAAASYTMSGGYDPTTGEPTDQMQAIAGQTTDTKVITSMAPVAEAMGVQPGQLIPTDQGEIPAQAMETAINTWLAQGGEPMSATELFKRYQQIAGGDTSTQLQAQGEADTDNAVSKVATEAGVGGKPALDNTTEGGYSGLGGTARGLAEDVLGFNISDKMRSDLPSGIGDTMADVTDYLTKSSGGADEASGTGWSGAYSGPGGLGSALADWMTGAQDPSTIWNQMLQDEGVFSYFGDPEAATKAGVATSSNAQSLNAAAKAGGYGNLAYLSTLPGDFDPSTLRLSGSEQTLGEVADSGAGGLLSHLTGAYGTAQDTLGQIESGSQTLDITDASGNTKQVTAEQLGMLQAGGGLSPDGSGGLTLNETGQKLIDSSAVTNHKVEVTATDKLKDLLSFEDVTDRNTGAGSTARAEHNYQAAQGGTPSGGPIK